MNPKIRTIDELIAIAASAKLRGLSVVTTNGCFDLLHVGQVATLSWAKTQGDILIVGTNSDKSVKDNKDSVRPIIPQAERALMLAALECVDYIFIFDEKSPISWINEIKPNVHVKGQGSESSSAFRSEEEAVMCHGGKIALAPKISGWSTTDVIAEVVRKYGAKA